MRRWGQAAGALALISALLAAPAPAQPRSLAGIDGQRLEWSELDKGTWIVVAWASWSPRCRDIVPRVNEIVRSHGRQARVITVNFQEDEDTVRAFLGGQGFRAPVYLDRAAAFFKKHEINDLPGVVVLVDGRPEFRGRLPRDVKEMLDRALKKRPAARE